VLAKHSVFLNGMTHVVITKLDVLDACEEIQVCVGYYINGKICQEFPSNSAVLEKCRPLYISMPGWNCPTAECRSYEELPQKAKEYLAMLEKAIGYPIAMISIGPEREQIITL
jgi:adenylosuccinate synthase